MRVINQQCEWRILRNRGEKLVQRERPASHRFVARRPFEGGMRIACAQGRVKRDKRRGGARRDTGGARKQRQCRCHVRGEGEGHTALPSVRPQGDNSGSNRPEPQLDITKEAGLPQSRVAHHFDSHRLQRRAHALPGADCDGKLPLTSDQIGDNTIGVVRVIVGSCIGSPRLTNDGARRRVERHFFSRRVLLQQVGLGRRPEHIARREQCGDQAAPRCLIVGVCLSGSANNGNGLTRLPNR